MKTIDQLMIDAFHSTRDPRSDAYKRGVRAVLEMRINEVPFKDPYGPGTAESDAFYSGAGEGNFIWRNTMSNENATQPILI